MTLKILRVTGPDNQQTEKIAEFHEGRMRGFPEFVADFDWLEGADEEEVMETFDGFHLFAAPMEDDDRVGWFPDPDWEPEDPEYESEDGGGSGNASKATGDGSGGLDKDWVPYEGPRGGTGWRNTTSENIVYDTEKPEAEPNDPEDLDDTSLDEAGVQQSWGMFSATADELQDGHQIEYDDGENEWDLQVQDVTDGEIHAVDVETQREVSIPIGEDGEPATGSIRKPEPVFFGEGVAAAESSWLPEEGEPSETELRAEALRTAASSDGVDDTSYLEAFAARASEKGADEQDVLDALEYGLSEHPTLHPDQAEEVYENGQQLLDIEDNLTEEKLLKAAEAMRTASSLADAALDATGATNPGGDGTAQKASSGLSADEYERADDFMLDMTKRLVWWDGEDLSKAPPAWASDDTVPEFVKEVIQRVIDGNVVWSKFTGYSRQTAEFIQARLAEKLTQPQGWSIASIVDDLQRMYSGMEDEQALNIARTEVSAIMNSAREEAYEERSDNDNYVYYWQGPTDHRTTEVCKEIKSEVEDRGGNVPLEELRAILRTTAKRYEGTAEGGTPERVSEWVPHYQCRHTFIRDVRATL